ncbi:hypothetical protein DMUE_1465 [Dictyocoela muelleri]|nr:hypothetical protein DMUE_1465 [Dictyocoela muelleri]
MYTYDQEIEFFGFNPKSFLADLKIELSKILNNNDNNKGNDDNNENDNNNDNDLIISNFNNEFSLFEDICLKTIFKIDFPFERKKSILNNDRKFDEFDQKINNFFKIVKKYLEKKKMLNIYKKQKLFYEEIDKSVGIYDEALDDFDEMFKYLTACYQVYKKLPYDFEDNGFYELLKSKEMRNKIYNEEKLKLQRKGLINDLEMWIKEIRK